jgi:ubiquinone/menaquinone biosynthesis C-methylase UbiE
MNTIQEANRNQYESYYDKPDWWFRFRYDTQVKRKTITHLIGRTLQSIEKVSVFEIGFGSGAVLFSFKQNCQIHGAEISSSAVKHALRTASQKKYTNYSFHVLHDEVINFPNDTFDIVIASHVMEHVLDDRKVITDLLRILKPGGIGVFLVPINENYVDPNHIRAYTPESFDRILLEIGFSRIVHKMQNELLFHLVEKFYFENHKIKYPLWGAFVSGLFNFPASMMPFGFYQFADKILMSRGLKPRQYACVARKRSE